MGDIAAAFRMLDTFASCGAESFVITKTELEWPGHKKVIWGKTYPLDELRQKLPAMVRTAAERHPVTLPDGGAMMSGENLIMRPFGRNTAFVQLDDLAPEQLKQVRDAVCIIHATSPGNYQAWIAVSGVPEGKDQSKEFARRVREAVGSYDKSASGATRVAGTENFKVKYAPRFPTVTIEETHPGRVMTLEQLQSMGLLAEPEPVKAQALKFTRRAERDAGKARHNGPATKSRWQALPKAMTDRIAAEPISGGATLPCSADGAPRRRRRNSWR
jgi:RepB DNA-primase from phage plasmid